MAIETTQQQLERVQALIAHLESLDGGVAGVEEHQTGPERWRMQRLDTLYRREERLIAKLAAESGGGMSLFSPI